MPLQLPEAPTLGSALHASLVRECQEVSDALAAGPTEPGVHRARKACKRGRALAELIAPAVGRRAARELARGYRDVARPLGPVRDHDVLRRRLEALGRDPSRSPPVDRAGPHRAALDALGLLTADLSGDPPEVDASQVQGALRRSWRRARHALREVRPSDAETAHAWRKRVKALWIQVDLLTSCAPDALGPLTAPLDALQETLGDQHDLAVLAEVLSDDPSVVADADERGAALLDRAVRQGRVLLAARPKHVQAWLAADWRR